MHGDFTRWTYDQELSFRSVLMQQGRVLLDAEWNEQTAITAHHDETRTRDIVGASGGPAPLDGGPGPFAIVDLTDGSVPQGLPWAQLGISPGNYYVNGVLAEAWPNAAGAAPVLGWPLTDQPFLATVGAGAGASPGVPEPPTAEGDGRYVAYLDVWSHQVTADERPELLESALGGPDTATRERTVWQVRLERIGAADVCSTVALAEATRTPRRMAAGLRPPEDDTDPCQISAAGGYQRLENQLYRVQVHDVVPVPRFLWSRENGSVTARLLGIDGSVVPGMDAVLRLDREGRDPELSIRQGDLLEVTSADRQLRQLPGFLATAGPVDGTSVAVAWDAAGPPASLAALGRGTIVRRWEGGPTPLRATATDLEGGIVVRFPAGGDAAVGDFWLLPARTVRLAYGVTALRGTLEWPESAPGVPAVVAPRGPVHHVAPLAVLARKGNAWDLESDCRHLFPPLTSMVTLDLVGGDGQEAMPGDALDEPVRVVVRNGGLPVAGAPVRFTARGGALDPADPVTGLRSPVTASTDADGVAAVRWTLDAGGATTQTLVAQRLDDLGAGVDVEVIVSGRLSVAREVEWTPVCRGFAGTRTVQDALGRLAETTDLRLLGGDGQQVEEQGLTVPEHVRVILDSPCGPVAEAEILAVGSDGALVAAAQDLDPVPTSLAGTGAGGDAVAMTDGQGVATFVWQPAFGRRGSDVLRILQKGSDEGDIRVTAQLDAGSRHRPGMHVTRVGFGSDRRLENDLRVSARDLASGIRVELDRQPLPESVRGKPVGRVTLDLPWPVNSDGEMWNAEIIGVHTVELRAELVAKENILLWLPSDEVQRWLLGGAFFEVLGSLKQEAVLGRLQIDGWAVIDAEDPRQHLNGHANTVSVQGMTVLELPTTDDVTGGRFELWFHLGPDERRPPFNRFIVENFAGLTRTRLERMATDAGLEVTVVEESAPGTRKNVVLGTIPPEGELLPGMPFTIRVSSGMGG